MYLGPGSCFDSENAVEALLLFHRTGFNCTFTRNFMKSLKTFSKKRNYTTRRNFSFTWTIPASSGENFSHIFATHTERRDYLWQWKVSFYSIHVFSIHFLFPLDMYTHFPHIFHCLSFFLPTTEFRFFFAALFAFYLFVSSCWFCCVWEKLAKQKFSSYWIFLISRFFSPFPPLDETWVDLARRRACRRHAKEASSHSRGHRGERRLWINANRSNFKRKPFRDANDLDGSLPRELNRMHGIWGPFNSASGHHHRASTVRRHTSRTN